MALIVQKYGGTSVGSVERIHRVAEQVADARRAGHDLVVVLSAMSGETDRLMRLAHDVTPSPHEREMDMLLSTRERGTIALLALDPRGRGVNARAGEPGGQGAANPVGGICRPARRAGGSEIQF